jgi:hypothetical protein
MRERKWLVLGVIAVTAAAFVAAACGGSNPAAPSGTKKVVLRGTVLGASSASGQSAQVGAMGAGNGEKIKVTVQQNTAITTTVSSNGTFELEGVPEGKFTLVFSSTTTVLGTVTVPGGADHEINIVVNVTVNVVVIIKIEIDGHEVPHPGDGDDGDD